MSTLTKNEAKRALKSIFLSLKEKGVNYEMVDAQLAVENDIKGSNMSTEWLFEEEKLEDIKQTYSAKPETMKILFMPIILDKISSIMCYTFNNKMYLNHTSNTAVESSIDEYDIDDVYDSICEVEYYSNRYNCKCNRVLNTISFNYVICLSDFEVDTFTDEIKEYLQKWIIDGLKVFKHLQCDMENVFSEDELADRNFSDFVLTKQ